MMTRTLCLLALLGLAACGEPDYWPRSTHVEGSVAGAELRAPHALFSSEEGFLGQNSATVLISDVPHETACPQIQSGRTGPGGQSAVFDGGMRLPSLLLHVPAQSSLKGHRHELLENGFIAKFDPGCRHEPPTDGGATPALVCGDIIAASSGTIWVYETDSIRKDNLPHARARFDLTFPDAGERIHGAFLADPCAGVTSGCSMEPSAVAALGAIATAFILWRRRRAL